MVGATVADDRAIYVDNGCRVAPHCLPDFDARGDAIAGTGCPLADCIYEEPSALQAWIRGYQDKCKAAGLLRADGRKISDIAIELRVSKRTVYRMLRDSQPEART